MAIKLTSDVGFFAKVFGPDHTVTKAVVQMGAVGVQFTISLFTCSATYLGQTYQVSLTVGTTALMKDAVDSLIMEQNKKIIQQWVSGLMVKVAPSVVPDMSPVPKIPFQTVTPSSFEETKLVSVVITKVPADINNILFIKTIRTITGLTLGPAKIMAESAKSGAVVVLLQQVSHENAMSALTKLAELGVSAHINDPMGPVQPSLNPSDFEHLQPKPTAKPVSSVIKLREAQALGQKVKGTSTGSVYYCIALNERIRLAARIYAAGSISIRAEWDGATVDELSKLEESGMHVKSDYASIHLNAEGVPPARVIGAFVTGLGIKWETAVISASDLVIQAG